MKIQRITILALGLIGGSLAKALKTRGFDGEIVAWGRREASLAKGLELGLIDRYSLDLTEAIAGADVIVVATPTLIAADMIKQLAPLVNDQVIITDVASVKGNLLTAAKQAFGKVPANLVLGHPIAGSEKSGVEAAKADLYVNHRVILTPTDETNPRALQAIKAMWELTGAEVVEMPVAEHDEVLAATSHLPHVLAYTLVDALAGSPEQQNIFRFAAGGFRDFTRIASSDPTMWKDIALANSDAILKTIDLFSAQLSILRSAIETKDSENIMASFTRAKSARDKFALMLEKQSKDASE
ncbi:prephenate dehydrogenase/arogenate dehydrogenase family protein [Oceanicoccus sp. KOV_DT_Chl]|uniref:prephenate dehydrogenase/arogenate dehydrogenase family protein n=1 Tax=Oceanicoccus sp. KOV_DT_Chl TaxID=1904639 RepID=UPI000C7A6AC6|nr:prephenate dehydrogenase/arogenate dehydrogenase family protein [Oceanicoccus sp. KOV_DT_Chl]